MNVLHLVHRTVRPPSGAVVFSDTSNSPLAHVVACGSTAPVAAVTALARSMAEDPADSQAGPRIRPARLITELTSRPGRRIETWLAWGALPGEIAAAAVGLVTLVTAYRGDQTRHSIGWLLVHPAARRCGLGRMLVATALAAADCEAAGEVWVETKVHWTSAIRFWRACGFAEPARPISESPA
jgi:GNAT superfamily N-acetyltransferase